MIREKLAIVTNPMSTSSLMRPAVPAFPGLPWGTELIKGFVVAKTKLVVLCLRKS